MPAAAKREWRDFDGSSVSLTKREEGRPGRVCAWVVDIAVILELWKFSALG